MHHLQNLLDSESEVLPSSRYHKLKLRCNPLQPVAKMKRFTSGKKCSIYLDKTSHTYSGFTNPSCPVWVLRTILKNWKEPKHFLHVRRQEGFYPQQLKNGSARPNTSFNYCMGAIDLFPGSWGATVWRTHFPWNQPPKISSDKMIMSYSSWNELISFSPQLLFN